MISKKNISTLVVAFLVVSFLLIALPEKGIANSDVLFGCCIKDNLCVGCVSGCATTKDFCTKKGGDDPVKEICINDGGGAVCNDSLNIGGDGCCVTGPNDCEGGLGWRACIGDSQPQNDVQTWHLGVSCSEVQICNIAISPIPTLNQWGLIAMAGLLGLFGLFIIIRRHRYNVG